MNMGESVAWMALVFALFAIAMHDERAPLTPWIELHLRVQQCELHSTTTPSPPEAP